MTGLESIGLQIGLSLTKSLLSSLLTTDNKSLNELSQATIEGLNAFVGSRVDDSIQGKKAIRFIEGIADSIGAKFIEQIKQTNLPENEAQAVLIALNTTIVGVHPQQVIDSGYSPEKLAHTLSQHSKAAWQDLSQQAKTHYTNLLLKTTQQIQDSLSEMPGLTSTSLQHLITKDRDTSEKLEQIWGRLELMTKQDDKAQGFTRKYLDEIKRSLNKLDHMGLNIRGDLVDKIRLQDAYITLLCDYDSEFNLHKRKEKIENLGNAFLTGRLDPISIEGIIKTYQYTMLIGEAGSGKTTMLRWLAVQAAQEQFTLKGTEPCVPFYIKFRDYSAPEAELPVPSEFIKTEQLKVLNDQMPVGWIQKQLEKPNGSVLLIDGFDEITGSKREKAKDWLDQIIQLFPHTHIVVTTRPTAIQDGWLDDEKFLDAQVQPLNKDNIPLFIEAWHKALQAVSQEETTKIDHKCQTTTNTIISQAIYVELAKTPLLLGAMCALNYFEVGNESKTRAGIYKALSEILLEKRDDKRGIRSKLEITLNESVRIYRKIADWMIGERVLVAPKRKVLDQIENPIGKDYSEETILQHLLERSGLLQSPNVDEIEFIHPTFQEYFAADYAVLHHRTTAMLDNCNDSRYKSMIHFAAGIAADIVKIDFQKELFTGLFAKGEYLTLLEATRDEIALESQEVVQQCLSLVCSTMMRDEPKYISAAGTLALPYLAFEAGRGGHRLGKRIDALAMIDDPKAYEVLKSYQGCKQQGVINALLRNAPKFGQERLIRDFLVPLNLDLIQISWHSLDGLEQLENLPYLSIFQSSIQDLSHLEKLPNLRSISLSSMQNVEDLSFLENLQNLEYVFLDGLNNLQDLSFLEKLKNLHTIRLSYLPRIKDLSFLEQFNHLQSLHIRSLPDLQDWRFLNNLVNLKYLALEQVNNFTDLSILENLIDLESLTISGILVVQNWNFLEKLSKLTSISIGDIREVQDWSFLEKLSKLQSIAISYIRNLPNMDFLEKLSDLQSISLVGIGNVTDLSFLGKLTTLQSIDIRSFRDLEDLSFLEKLTNLKSIYLGFMEKVHDLSCLERLTNLQEFNLSYMKNLHDLSVLASLPNLEEISLGDCQHIKNWSFIEKLSASPNLDFFSI